MGRGNFWGKGAHYEVYGLSAVSCAKTAELIEMLFGLWTRVDPKKCVLDEGPDPHAKGQFF